MNKNDPINSEIYEAKIFLLVGLSLNLAGLTEILSEKFSWINLQSKAPAIPPANYPAMYINPFNLLDPSLEFFLTMKTSVIAGLKWAPEICSANNVMTHKERKIPSYESPISG